MFTNTVTHVYLQENLILLIHTSLSYGICTGLDGLVNGTSIGLFQLSMVLRLKRPSLIKFRHGVEIWLMNLSYYFHKHWK